MEHILITGASGGLGQHVTAKFLSNGFHVSAFVSHNTDPGFMTHPSLNVFRSDLLNAYETEAEIKRASEGGAGIDAGILLAGGFGMGQIQDTSLKDIEKMYNLNFVTAYNAARPILRIMQAQGKGGQIILIGARPAFKPKAARQMVAYAFSKSLIFRLAEVINSEGKENGITASVVVPSVIDTPANRKAMPESDPARWVTPEEIADNLLHLMTPAGRKLRKTILKVYGDS
jgi:NAD(P)-dependent dehydrogenase (short-subunit alcohol dehydrogenase family)